MTDTPTTRTGEVILEGLTVDLTEAAVHAGAAYLARAFLGPVPTIRMVIKMWEDMTGLPAEEAEALSTHLITRARVTAKVVPF
jgi:hypothetical protein